MNSNNLLVTDASNLRTLIDRVHDLWFDVEQVSRDFSLGVVSMLLYQDGDLKRNHTASEILKISSVERLQIHDTEQIGYYDINEIKIDPIAGVVTIIGCIPITITAYVARVRIDLVRMPPEPGKK